MLRCAGPIVRCRQFLSPPVSPLGLPLSASEKVFRFHDGLLLLSLLGKLAVGGLLAFGLGFSEFLLVSKTSSLALSISGIFKVSFLPSLLLPWFSEQPGPPCRQGGLGKGTPGRGPHRSRFTQALSEACAGRSPVRSCTARPESATL